MRHVRMLGLCLLALFAIAAVGAAGASAAQPTFSTTLAGKFAATTLEAKSTKGAAEVVKCTKGTSTGALTGTSEFSETITLVGCKSNAGATACGNVGAETIETNGLTGELYWVNKAETTPGAVVGQFFTDFKCGTESVEIEDDVVGSITNSKTGFSIKYKVKSGKQEFHDFFIEGSEVGPFSLESEPGKVESGFSTTGTYSVVVQA